MNKKRLIIIVAIVTVILLALVFGSRFVFSKTCEDQECFDSLMESCKRGSYVNEEKEASWGYKIKGQRSGECAIEVTLLQAKEGDLKLRNFESHEMICSYELGKISAPGKDLGPCTGELKENLQAVLIENLHAYILDNLEDIKEGLFG